MDDEKFPIAIGCRVVLGFYLAIIGLIFIAIRWRGWL
jgi:hypothetical protein